MWSRKPDGGIGAVNDARCRKCNSDSALLSDDCYYLFWRHTLPAVLAPLLSLSNSFSALR